MIPSSVSSQVLSNSDSVTCYTKPELKKIASALVLGDLYKSDHKADSSIIVNLTNNFNLCTSIRNDQHQQLRLQGYIIQVKESQITTLNKSLKKQVVINKFVKLGWLATTVVLGYLAVKH